MFLRDAWRVFAPQDLTRAYEAKPERNEALAAPSDAGFFLKVISAVAITATYLDDRKSIENSMRDFVYQELCEEKLIAFGHKENQKNPYALQKIAAQFWRDADIIWNDNSAINPTEEYSRICIVQACAHPELLAAERIGRPTNRSLISAAINVATANNSEFLNLTNKEKNRIVRDYISQDNPEIDVFGKGWSDDAIRKHIAEYKKRLQ